MSENRLMVSRGQEFSYPICLERDYEALPAVLGEVGLAGKSCMVVSDSNVAPLYLEKAMEALEKAGCRCRSFCFPAGEEHKTLATVQELYERLIQEGFDRSGFLAALGGGVCGDLTGYASATYLRGVDFIQLPTSLLAQVDSSVGGKTGVDFLSYKNMVGAFHQPRLVYMNLSVLATLPDDQLSSGMGEVIKTGLICDEAFFHLVGESTEKVWNRDFDTLARLIRRCVEIKAEVVERDPMEKGERALLNLGHTIGHAIEKSMDFRLLHGQCVGLGLIAAARICVERHLMSGEQMERIVRTCKAYGLPLTFEGPGEEVILAATKKDKKMEAGHVKFILMEGLGHAFIDKTVSDEELLLGIRQVRR